MGTKPTYEELEQRVNELEQESVEWKQNERKLQEKMIQLNTILSHAPLVLSAVNLEGEFILSEGKGLEALGRKPQQFVGVSAFDIYKKSNPDIVEYIRRAMSGESVNAEVELDSVVFNVNYDPIRDDTGKTIGVVAVSNIITARKRAEEALRESEEKYRTLFESMAQGVFYQQADGRLVDVNSAALEMFGLTHDQFIGKTSRDPHWKVVHEDGSDFPGEQHPSMKALKTGKTVRNAVAGVYNTRKKDYVWMNINAIPQFRPGEDDPYQVVVTLHDITDRKQAEEKIKASLKEKEILLQEIHHRAKNNMQIISSLLKLQTSSSKDKKVENALKESQGRVRAMSLAHETLYDTESMVSIDFSSYISRLSKAVFQSYGIRREQVELKVEAENISFKINQLSHIGLVINELVSNSLKYAFPENRKGEIVIRLCKIDQDEIELTVSDNGLGIPESIDWRNTETLGLNLVKMLAEDQLDGTLNLDRVNGTHFNIKFKLKES